MYELALKNGKKIQIDQNDFAKQLNWSTAKLKCEEIGEGWRLPTISELEEIFENKEDATMSHIFKSKLDKIPLSIFRDTNKVDNFNPYRWF